VPCEYDVCGSSPTPPEPWRLTRPPVGSRNEDNVTEEARGLAYSSEKLAESDAEG
jgi:hypothetical protein